MNLDFTKLCCDCEYEWVPDDHYPCNACRDKSQRDCDKKYFKRKSDPEDEDLEGIESVYHNLICPWCGYDRLTIVRDECKSVYGVKCPRCQRSRTLNTYNPIREWAEYCIDVIKDNCKYPPAMAAALNGAIKELESIADRFHIDPVELLNVMKEYKHVLEANTMNEKEEVDVVNHPSHYETGKFECIKVMEEAIGKEEVKGFCICNAFKYLYRCRRKNGLEDIKKAKWYIDKFIELCEEDLGNEDN